MKLNAIDAAVRLEDLRLSPSNRLEALRGTARGSIAFASIINGESAFSGAMDMRRVSR